MYEVDASSVELRRNGTPVKLREQSFLVLFHLLEHAGEIVTREELHHTLWPSDTFVDFDQNLSTAVMRLRNALGDNAETPVYIETIPKHGYRFVAPISLGSNAHSEPRSIDEADGSEREMGATAENGASTAAPITPEAPSAAAAKHEPELRSSKKWILSSTVLLVGVAAAGAFLYFHPSRKVLTEKDTIVLADFDNSTGDPVFDGTLRRGMAVQLEQSPFLSLIEDDRIRQVLREMGQPAGARLTPAVARELCVRTASTAVLDGSIAPLGSQYVLGLRARDCAGGKVLAEEQVQAARKEDVLPALDQMAGKFRTQVGESLASVEKYDTPLAEATTSSLEALKAYSLGLNKLHAGAFTEALPFFSRAVELDPNFAAAYSATSSAYINHSEPELAAENIRKAYQLRDRVSEREHLGIEVYYYWYGTGELEKAVSSAELLTQTYPRDASPHNRLGALYVRLGNPEKSVEEFHDALRLDPNSGYLTLGWCLTSLNRLDEAEAVYKLSDERNLPHTGLPKALYLLAFLKGDQARMARLAASVAGNRTAEDVMLSAQADTEAWYGRLRAARGFTQRAMDLSLESDAKETAAAHQVLAALFEVESGEWEQGRSDANAALKLAPNRDVRLIGALALAQAGDTAPAEKLAAGLDNAFPLDTLVQRYWLPVIRAAIALERKHPNRAIELL